jgi:cytochrome c553
MQADASDGIKSQTMWTETLAAGLLLTTALGVGVSAQTKSSTAEKSSEACAGCHADIYKSYQKTVMAKASGMAKDGRVHS